MASIRPWSYALRRGLGETLGLAGRSEDRTPPTARRIEAFGLRGKELDRDVDKALVHKTDHDAGPARHCGVHGMTREQIAEKIVFAIGRPAANLVARIEVAEHNRDALSRKMRLDLLAKERANVLQLDVPGSIACRGGTL